MSIKTVNSEHAPAAIGTYSQAVVHGDTIYISGQIPLLPDTMELVSENIEEQINQVFDNLRNICEACNEALGQIVKLNVYLVDLDHFPLINKVMAEFFNAPYPARAAIGISALPRGALVEMDAIVARSGAGAP